MSRPIKIRITDVRGAYRNAFTRLPFRYGVVTLTAMPLYHLAVTIEDENGRKATGYASDCFPPKWFDKNPDKTYDQEIEEMHSVVLVARKKALEIGEGTPFEIHQAIYPATLEFGDQNDMTRLTAGFGPTFVDRAIIDAVGRTSGLPFHTLVKENLLGIDLGWYYDELAGTPPSDVILDEPLTSVHARHTVGLVDPITDEEIEADARLNDGLPQSLEEVIRVYGVTYFKIKVWGDMEKDTERLGRMIEVIERNVGGDYHCSLDGNENFKDAASFLELVELLRSEDRFKRFFDSILFIEQPIARDQALTEASGEIIRKMGKVKPVIIDESDQDKESFPTALELGYRGISHKNCKGIYKSLANMGLIKKRNKSGTGDYLMSSEDLATMPVPALQSDLCAVASLGIPHLERNGHHFFPGLSHLSENELEAAVRNHPRLYRIEDGKGFLKIENGQLDIRSLQCRGFGIGFDLDMDSMTPEDEWQFESLGVS